MERNGGALWDRREYGEGRPHDGRVGEVIERSRGNYQQKVDKIQYQGSLETK
jgi:hypothetical protein